MLQMQAPNLDMPDGQPYFAITGLKIILKTARDQETFKF